MLPFPRPAAIKVGANVYNDEHDPQCYLYAPRHCPGVYDGKEVVFDEAAAISASAAHLPKAVFNRREWTYPSGKFYEDGPGKEWQM